MYKIGYITAGYEVLPDPKLLTHICYCFAELYMEKDKYTGFKIEGEDKDLQNIVALKNINPNLKVLITFTSWISNEDNKQEGGFSALCADENNIKRYCDDCKVFLEEYNLDGIILNWEFPTLHWSNQKPRCDDKDNFDILVKNLRNTLPNYILGVATDWSNDFFNIKNFQDYVDFVTVMCYDIRAGLDKQAHNDIYYIHKSIEIYKQNNFDMGKYILGVPCYGRLHFSSIKNPGRPKTLSNKYIKSKEYPYFITHINDIPWLMKYNEDKIEYICSFEDDISVHKKIEIIRDFNLLGVSIWNLNLDELDDYNVLKYINNSEFITQNQ